MHTNSDFVVTDRGGIVESRHQVHAAVVSAEGKILFAVGDPSRMTLARSAAKPGQALAVIETGGTRQYGFDAADLALMCASHSSEDRHIARARSMLSKIDAKETDLSCGGHPSISDAVNRSWIKKDFTPTPVCSNCSGKHVGMLAGARAIGADMTDYHLPHHPLQEQVKRTVAELCDLESHEVEWEIDGCNLPTPAFPLDRLARMYCKIASAADTIQADTCAPARTQALADIYNAMTGYPEMVAGEGRYCTILMKAFEGSLVGKLGADGCYGIGVRDGDDTRRLGSTGAVGISAKIEDGNVEILYATVSEILERLDVGRPEARRHLASFHKSRRLNTMGVETGGIAFPFNLRPV